MNQIIILLITFLAITLLAYAIFRFLVQVQMQRRLKRNLPAASIIEDTEPNRFEETIATVATPFAKLSLPEEGWEKSNLRKQFMHAGYRLHSMPIYFFAIKTVLTIIVPLIIFVIGAGGGITKDFNQLMTYCLFAAAIGYVLPSLILDYKIKIRQRDLFENFPDAIDLMTVCVEAGMGMDAAISKVSEEMRLKCLPLAEELHLVMLELRAGRSREEALHNLALRTGVEDVEGLVAMLVQTDRFGTSIADALRVHSDMLRTKRRLRAEEAAAKIALKLLFPLIFCIFPTVFLVAIGPSVIHAYRVFTS